METNNLLSKEIEELGLKLQGAESRIIEINNLIKLLMRSLKDSNDISVKEVLDIANKKLESLLDEGIIYSYGNIDKLISIASDLESKPTPKRRARNTNPDAPKKTRKPRSVKNTDTVKENTPEDVMNIDIKESTKDETNKINKEDKKA